MVTTVRNFALLALVLLATAAFAADTVPLSTNLTFDPAGKRSTQAVTLLVPAELSQAVIRKKLRLLRLDFPLGNAVAVNTENALRSAFAKVRLARAAEDVETDLVLEARAFEVEPKLPLTTFGTYTSRVKLTYVLRDLKKKSEREIVVDGDGGNKKHAGRVIWDAGWKWTEAQQLAKATDLATLDALDKLLQDLTR